MLRQKIEMIKEYYNPSVIGIATGGVTITSKKFYLEGKQVIDFLSSMQGEVSVWNPEHISISGIIHGTDDNAPGICFEISIPDGWNGKLVQLRGGCFCGFVLLTNSYAYGETEDNPTLLAQMKAVRNKKVANILTKDGGQAWLSEEECSYVKQVVMECCDGLDGVKDGIISNWQGALEQWEESKWLAGGTCGWKRPDELILKDINPPTAGRTRPIYPYPDYPVNVGEGDVNRAENFVSSRVHLQE